MTKKDYILIVRAIKPRLEPYLEPNTNLEVYSVLRGLIDDLVIELSQDNPRFSRDKFLTALGFSN